MFLFLQTINYVHGGIDAPNIIIDKIYVKPNNVSVGNFFNINATIENISPYTIEVLTYGCKSPLKVIFNNNVMTIPVDSAICSNIKSPIKIEPNSSTTLSSSSGVEKYFAVNSGKTNTTLEVEYKIYKDVKNKDENKPTIYTWFKSTQFVFDIKEH
jgi:hypothetical protein